MSAPSDRRGFLRGLAMLPLIGGGVTLLGKPTAAAEPVTRELLDSYDCWLFYERRYLRAEREGHAFWTGSADPKELASYDRAGVNREFRASFDWIPMANGSARYHYSADPLVAPQPSTRAAVVLSAVGCDWRELRT